MLEISFQFILLFSNPRNTVSRKKLIFSQGEWFEETLYYVLAN